MLAEAGVEATITVLEALGGPRERIRRLAAADAADAADARAAAVAEPISHPVAAAIEVRAAPGLPLTPGRPDDLFETDGQITRAPVRALTLAALAPRPGQHLWDIGAGSGAVAIEWLLAHASLTATAVEARPDRAARADRNAAMMGADRLRTVVGRAPAALHDLHDPDAVFVGGGLCDELLAHLRQSLAPGTRLVANAVTLEAEALMIRARAELGGDLMRIDLAAAAPLGRLTGWQPGRPIVQWSVTL